MDGPLYGAQRYLTINNVVYILNTDITDAVAIYKVLSKAHALGNVFYSGSKILGNVSISSIGGSQIAADKVTVVSSSRWSIHGL